jgi:hypothetical protein
MVVLQIMGTNLMEELDKALIKLSLRYLNFVPVVNKDPSSISSIRNGLVAIIKNKIEFIMDN